MANNIELDVRFRHLKKEESKILFSKTLRYFRISKGLSQSELGDKLEIPLERLQRYEDGRIRIPTPRLIKLCLDLVHE